MYYYLTIPIHKTQIYFTKTFGTDKEKGPEDEFILGSFACCSDQRAAQAALAGALSVVNASRLTRTWAHSARVSWPAGTSAPASLPVMMPASKQ